MLTTPGNQKTVNEIAFKALDEGRLLTYPESIETTLEFILVVVPQIDHYKEPVDLGGLVQPPSRDG
jgi:hypothetical protein